MAETYTNSDVITVLTERNILFADPDTPLGFLERQIIRETKRNLEFDISFQTKRGMPVFFEHLTDLTHLLGYLTGNVRIIGGTINDRYEKAISVAEDMYMLKSSEIGITNQEYRTDIRLYELNRRITSRRRNYPTIAWGKCIDEVGSDEAVIRSFGRPLTNKMRLVMPKYRPPILTLPPIKKEQKKKPQVNITIPKITLPKPKWGEEPSNEAEQFVRDYYLDLYRGLEKDLQKEKGKDRKPYK